jgi:hypothetical protein
MIKEELSAHSKKPTRAASLGDNKTAIACTELATLAKEYDCCRSFSRVLGIALNRELRGSLVWRHNLVRIFPNNPAISRIEATEICESLMLQNRIAHHEPIFHFPLERLREDLGKIIYAICHANYSYAEFACTFSSVRGLIPKI